MRWLISVPVWGEQYRQHFIRHGLPALHASAVEAQADVRFMVHTDDQASIKKYMEAYFPVDSIECLPVPASGDTPSDTPIKLSAASQIALEKADHGTCVMFYNSDQIVSHEIISACERRFAEGKMFVTAHSIRMTETAPPIGLSGRDLSAWGFARRHKWVNDCVFGSGHCLTPAIVVFISGDNAVVHCFTLQCVAVHKTRDVNFRGPTLDQLVGCFTPDEVHVVTSPDEFAIVESCPTLPDYSRNENFILDEDGVAGWSPSYASKMMNWQFSQQIVIVGNPQQYAQNVANSILTKISGGINYQQSNLPQSDVFCAIRAARESGAKSFAVKVGDRLMVIRL